jgi:hypothetical protein
MRGAKHAYRHVAGLWGSKTTWTQETTKKLATPFISEMLSQVHQINRHIHQIHTEVAIHEKSADEPVLATILKMEVEEGRGHTHGQWLGFWDGDEVWAQLMDGVSGTEAQMIKVVLPFLMCTIAYTSSCFLVFWVQELENRKRAKEEGTDPDVHLPRRVVAHVLFLARESCSNTDLELAEEAIGRERLARLGEVAVQQHQEKRNVGSRGRGEPGFVVDGATGGVDDGAPPVDLISAGGFDPQQRRLHVWEFESDFGVVFPANFPIPLRWRIRNINGAIEPRSGQVLNSEGCVDHHMALWVY